MENEPQVTGEQQGDAAGPVDEAGMENATAGSEHEGQQVPLSALQAERSDRQRLQDELGVIKENMQLMMSQLQQQQQPRQEPKDEFSGLSDDDVLTVGEFKKALSQKERQYEMSLEELKMTQRHPDYEQVVTQYLPEVLKNNPGLRRTLQQTNDYELAYVLAKNSDGYRSANKKTKVNEDAQRIIENSQKSGSLSSVGHTSPISEAKRYRDMSDAEFRAMAQKNLGHF